MACSSYDQEEALTQGALRPRRATNAAMSPPTAEVNALPGVGMGQAIRLQSPTVAGAGLAVDDALVHLAAFRVEGNEPMGEAWQGSRMARPSRRFAWAGSPPETGIPSRQVQSLPLSCGRGTYLV